MLIILDGWGETQNPNVSAIYKAKTPYFDSLINNYPNATLHRPASMPRGRQHDMLARF